MERQTIHIFMNTANDIVNVESVAIISILANTLSKCHFHFLENRELQLTEMQKMKLEDIKSKFPNFEYSIYTINPEKYKKFKQSTVKYIPEDTYFRYEIADLVPEIDKAIYLDIDVICCCDIKELYNTDLKGNMLGAVRNEKGKYLDNNMLKIITKCNLKDPSTYFNNGVLLMDLKAFRENNIKNKLEEKTLSMIETLDFADQDIFNIVFEDSNIELHNKFNLYPNRIKDCNFTPAIIHCVGKDKPWNSYGIEKASDLFWKYAEISPFNEEIKELHKINLINRRSKIYRTYSFLGIRIKLKSKDLINKYQVEENSYMENIFSIKNSKDRKYKILTLLGMKYRWKKH